MKKNIMGLSALVLAIAFSAFTVTKFDNKYAVYSSASGTNPQTIPSNYTIETEDPGQEQGANFLAWIRFSDADTDGVLDQSELNSVFSTYDTDLNNSLDNNSEVAGILEKKQSQ